MILAVYMEVSVEIRLLIIWYYYKAIVVQKNLLFVK